MLLPTAEAVPWTINVLAGTIAPFSLFYAAYQKGKTKVNDIA